MCDGSLILRRVAVVNSRLKVAKEKAVSKMNSPEVVEIMSLVNTTVSKLNEVTRLIYLFVARQESCHALHVFFADGNLMSTKGNECFRVHFCTRENELSSEIDILRNWLCPFNNELESLRLLINVRLLTEKGIFENEYNGTPAAPPAQPPEQPPEQPPAWPPEQPPAWPPEQPPAWPPEQPPAQPPVQPPAWPPAQPIASTSRAADVPQPESTPTLSRKSRRTSQNTCQRTMPYDPSRKSSRTSSSLASPHTSPRMPLLSPPRTSFASSYPYITPNLAQNAQVIINTIDDLKYNPDTNRLYFDQDVPIA